MGRVTKTERNRAHRQARETARFERRSAEAATRLGFKLQSRVIRAFRRGELTEIRQIIEDEFKKVTPLLTESMVVSYLAGLDRLKEFGTRPISAQLTGIATPIHRGAMKYYVDRLMVDPARLREIQTSMNAQAIVMLKRLEDNVNRGVDRTVNRAIQDGLTSVEGAKVLKNEFAKRGIVAVNPFEYETQFRTATQIAYSAGEWDAAHDPLADGLLWGYKYATVGDDRVRPEHAALDGVTARKDDPMWSTIFPPNGWNSVPPETPILTEQGWRPIVDIRHGDRVVTHKGRLRKVRELHRHEGPDQLVRVELDRRGVGSLSLTGNHRVMTDQGWVEASRLEVGDNVLHAVDVSVPNESGWDIEYIRQAERVYDRHMTSEIRAGLMSLKFDADSKARQIEVDPESTGALIEYVGDLHAMQQARESFLVNAHLRGGVRMGRGVGAVTSDLRRAHLLPNFWTPSGGRHREGGGSSPSVIGIPSVFDNERLASSSHLDVVSGEESSEGAIFNAGRSGDHGEIGSTGQVIAEHSTKTAVPTRLDSRCRSVVPCAHGAIVTLGFSPVKRIDVVPNRSKVYNLAVEDDDSYIAAGIATHNCRCQIIYLFEPEEVVRPGPRQIDDDRIVVGRPDEGWAWNPGTVLSRTDTVRKPEAVGEKVLKTRPPWKKAPPVLVAPTAKSKTQAITFMREELIDPDSIFTKNQISPTPGLEDLPLKSLNVINKELARLTGKYKIKLDAVGLSKTGRNFSIGQRGSWAALHSGKGGTRYWMALRQSGFGNLTKFRKVGERAFQGKYWAFGTPEGYIAHEYGHALFFSKGQKARDIVFKVFRERNTLAVKNPAEAIGAQISRYGARNASEMFAEAFARSESGLPLPQWAKKMLSDVKKLDRIKPS